ncbi:hypothetical protein BX666DRAFT_1860992 [Dichotomocladium elegans]|nr:hypothetical protein BX666DRAFT_1860992 [Dichotomocladium elegans]
MLDEDTFSKLWKLTNEWAAQQKSNHELASDISKQIADYKKQGSALAKLDQQQSDNVDRATVELLTDYKALLDLYQKVLSQNQTLQREKSQLEEICKEYEDKLETVVGKLRSHTVATTEGHAQLRREYEALLDAEKV